MIQTMFKNKQKRYGNRAQIGRHPHPPFGKFHNFFFFEPFPYGVNVTYLNTVKQAGPAL